MRAMSQRDGPARLDFGGRSVPSGSKSPPPAMPFSSASRPQDQNVSRATTLSVEPGGPATAEPRSERLSSITLRRSVRDTGRLLADRRSR